MPKFLNGLCSTDKRSAWKRLEIVVSCWLSLADWLVCFVVSEWVRSWFTDDRSTSCLTSTDHCDSSSHDQTVTLPRNHLYSIENISTGGALPALGDWSFFFFAEAVPFFLLVSLALEEFRGFAVLVDAEESRDDCDKVTRSGVDACDANISIRRALFLLNSSLCARSLRSSALSLVGGFGARFTFDFIAFVADSLCARGMPRLDANSASTSLSLPLESLPLESLPLESLPLEESLPDSLARLELSKEQT